MSRLELTSFRTLIDEVVDRARPHFGTLFPAIGLPMMLGGALIAIAQDRMMAMFVETDLDFDLAQAFGFFAIFFIVAAFFVLAMVALFVASMDVLAGRPTNMVRAWTFALRPKAFLTLVVTFALTFASLLACLVPAIWVFPLLSMVIPVMVVEERFGFAAIARSSSLVWTNPTKKLADSGFFQTLTLLVVAWMVQNALGILVQGPFAIAQNYLMFRDGVGGAVDPSSMMVPLWLQLPAQVASAGLTAAAGFYWSFGIGMLYFEIRRRRESFDLRRAVDELTGAATAERNGAATDQATSSLGAADTDAGSA